MDEKDLRCVPFRSTSRVQVQLFNALHERSLASDFCILPFLGKNYRGWEKWTVFPGLTITCIWSLIDVDRVMIASMCHHGKICLETLGTYCRTVIEILGTVAEAATSNVLHVACSSYGCRYEVPILATHSALQLNFTLQDLCVSNHGSDAWLRRGEYVWAFLPSYRDTTSLDRNRMRSQNRASRALKTGRLNGFPQSTTEAKSTCSWKRTWLTASLLSWWSC